MPFGFTKYMEKEGKSQETIAYYQHVVDQLFSFLDSELLSELEVYEIRYKHLQSFFRMKKKTCSNRSLNKYVAVMRSFFDYLWESKQIPIDPMAKFRYFDIEEPTVHYEYNFFKEKKDDVLSNQYLNKLEKAYYVLALHGLWPAHFWFTKDNVHVFDHDKIIINMDNRGKEHRTILLQGKDAVVFYDYFEQMLFCDTPYVFVQKKKETAVEEYEPMTRRKMNGIAMKLRDVVDGLEHFTLTDVRNAYIHYLNVKENYSSRQLAYLLGVNETRLALSSEMIYKRYQKISS